MNIAILGAGGMGSAMAARLVDTGHQVTMWDRNPAFTNRVAGIGVTTATDVAPAVADASVVITMLTNGEAVHSVAEQMLSSGCKHQPSAPSGRTSSVASRTPTTARCSTLRSPAAPGRPEQGP
jgi:3-hydroxyisobutyrate dehydrogenase-like beta-hydroxyacid dehydrogenase